jgi:hypothetical protein
MKVWQQKPKNVGSTHESLAEKTHKRIPSTGNQETDTPIIYTWFDVIHKFVEENT